MKARRASTNQHLRTRRDHANETAEDYVEAIADIELERDRCRVTDLAERFAVSHVTVSKTLVRLKKEGLVTAQPYGPVQLTDAGEKLAKDSKSRHELVLQFLRSLGVSDEVAAIDAEGIEHHVSQETIECMRKFCDRSNRSPKANHP